MHCGTVGHLCNLSNVQRTPDFLQKDPWAWSDGMVLVVVSSHLSEVEPTIHERKQPAGLGSNKKKLVL